MGSWLSLVSCFDRLLVVLSFDCRCRFGAARGGSARLRWVALSSSFFRLLLTVFLPEDCRVVDLERSPFIVVDDGAAAFDWFAAGVVTFFSAVLFPSFTCFVARLSVVSCLFGWRALGARECKICTQSLASCLLKKYIILNTIKNDAEVCV